MQRAEGSKLYSEVYAVDCVPPEAAGWAVLAQDACNASGLVQEWARAMNLLWEAANKEGQGTGWVNSHPVNVLFSLKLACLCTDSIIDSDTCELWESALSICREAASMNNPAFRPRCLLRVGGS